MKEQLTHTWRASLAFAISFGFASMAVAVTTPDQNWPQWRGPLQNGVAPSADPPVSWSETNNVKWKVKIPGGGSATPIIWDNMIFVQTAIPTGKKVEAAPASSGAGDPPAPPAGGPPPPPRDGTNGAPPRPPGGGPGGGRGRGGFAQKPTESYQFAVLCLDRQTGKVLWQRVAREEVPHEGVMQNEGTFASPSGLTDGQHVFAYFGSRGLYCYDLSGNLQWKQDFGRMRIAMSFGEGSSPTLYKDSLIINWDNEDGSFITAIDKNTGKALWKESRNEHTSWSTPIVVEYDGKPQIITTATGKIRSYDPATGKVIWECGGLTRNVIPSPVADGSTVYCMSGFMGNSLLAIRLGRSGDLTGTDAVAWTHKKSTPYVPSPLLYGDKLYFYANNNAILSCLNTKSGEPLFDAERVEGLSNVYASPVGASGHIYLAGRNGTTVVLKQSDKFEVVATNQLEEKFDASPAAVGKELFLRGRGSLYCIAEK